VTPSGRVRPDECVKIAQARDGGGSGHSTATRPTAAFCRPGAHASSWNQRRAGRGDGRTRLADERTYLAWWRTGFAAFAVSLGAGKIVPSLTKGPRWPYTILGASFAVLGVVLVGYGLLRQRQVEAAITRGDFAPPNEILIAVLAATSMLLGVALLVLVVVS